MYRYSFRSHTPSKLEIQLHAELVKFNEAMLIRSLCDEEAELYVQTYRTWLRLYMEEPPAHLAHRQPDINEPGGPMLPFLKPKAQSSVTMTNYSAKGQQEVSHEEGDVDPGLMAAAEAAISAANMKDAKAFAMAMQDMFMMLDSEPEGDEHNQMEFGE